MATKIVGWSLLGVGLLIMAYSMFYSYNIFTAKIPVPELFKIESNVVESEPIDLKNNPSKPGDINNIIGEQIKNALPLDFLPRILNLTSWSILAGILIFGGSKVSGLGIKLIKQ